MKKTNKKISISLFLFACAAFSVVPTTTTNVKADEAKEVKPIAKYEFNDATNPGKDTMGNYDLVKSGSGNITLSDGAATFDGTAGLIPSSNDLDVTEDLKSFTLAFETTTTETYNSWGAPVSFGWNGWDATKWGVFHFGSGSNDLRFSIASALVNGAGNVNVDCNNNPATNPYHGPTLGTITDSNFHKVLLSVNLEGTIDVYFDGTAKYSYPTPAGFSLSDDQMRFAIGADSCWGNLYNNYIGSVRNVSIYDFAFDADQVTAYSANGKLTTDDIDLSIVSASMADTLYVPAGADNNEIMMHASNSVVDVTMSDESVVEATVKWDKVVEVDGVKQLEGTIQGLLNPNDVKAYATISFVENVKEILPIAKYEFKDPTNPGKDTMGNYDLIVKGDGDAQGTVSVENGVATFNGTGGLIAPDASSNIAKDLESFTLSFDIMSSGAVNSWEEPIGFGWNGWDATKWNLFELSGGSNLLRFSASGSLVDSKSDVDGNLNQWWAPEIGTIGSNLHNVVLSVDLEGKIEVYLDGVNKYSKQTPENYSVQHDNMYFAIGANGSWGGLRNFFNGQIANVAIYDFAVNEQQAKVLGYTKQVKTTTVSDLVYVNEISSTPVFENETVASETLKDTMTAYEMLKVINKANVVATLSNDETVSVPVEWKDIEVNGDVYTLVGQATVGNEHFTTVRNVEIRYELSVEKTQPVVPPTSENPSEEPSDDPVDEPSEEPTISEPTGSTQEPAKKGCKGSAATSLVGLLAVAAALILKNKKR